MRKLYDESLAPHNCFNKQVKRKCRQVIPHLQASLIHINIRKHQPSAIGFISYFDWALSMGHSPDVWEPIQTKLITSQVRLDWYVYIRKTSLQPNQRKSCMKNLQVCTYETQLTSCTEKLMKWNNYTPWTYLGSRDMNMRILQGLS